jgi:hypothetical protein
METLPFLQCSTLKEALFNHLTHCALSSDGKSTKILDNSQSTQTNVREGMSDKSVMLEDGDQSMELVVKIKE